MGCLSCRVSFKITIPSEFDDPIEFCPFCGDSGLVDPATVAREKDAESEDDDIQTEEWE